MPPRTWCGPCAASPARTASPVYVGGQTAGLIDTTHAIGTRLPLAGLLIVLTTFIVLFLFTVSVVQPIRALVLTPSPSPRPPG